MQAFPIFNGQNRPTVRRFDGRTEWKMIRKRWPEDPAVAVVRFAKWEQAVGFATQDQQYFFRGQADASWKLETSLERSMGSSYSDVDLRLKREHLMIKRFKAAAHRYLVHLPEDDNWIEWLALMQHHGCPTRLLDCTYSFGVAAYFAADVIDEARANVDFAIWGFKRNSFESCVFHAMKTEVANHVGDDLSIERMNGYANGEFSNPGANGMVYIVDPILQHERRGAQQGLFLMPSSRGRGTFAHANLRQQLDQMFHNRGVDLIDDRAPMEFEEFEKTLTAQTNARLAIFKMIMPGDCRRECLHWLYRMNIHAATLFPGIDGIARSLAHSCMHRF